VSCFPNHNAAGFIRDQSEERGMERRRPHGIQWPSRPVSIGQKRPCVLRNTFIRGLVNVGDLSLSTTHSETVAACSCHKLLSSYFTVTPCGRGKLN